jgi:signal transduction histidine kinase/ActR/RegA family two-component response regulator
VTLPRPARLAVIVTGVYAAATAGLSFAGWAGDWRILTDWDNDGISIQPNATVAAAMAGFSLVSLAMGWRWVAALLGAIVFGIGFATLVEWIWRVDLGIDTLLMFDRTWGRRGVLSPGRMGPPGSMAWTLIGASLFIAAAIPRWRRAGPVLGVVVVSMSLLSISGYVFGIDVLYTVPTFTIIAIQTSTMIFAAGLGLIAAVPEFQPMRAVLERTAAGVLIRRMLPFVIAVPLAAGWLSLRGQTLGFYDPPMSVALLVLALVSLLCAVVWWSAAAVREHEHRSEAASTQLRDTLAQAERARLDAESANRAKDEFLAVLSHELRSPLNAMLGWTHVLRQRPGDQTLVATALDTVERNIWAQAQVIDDLLDISRIRSGKFILDRSPVDIRATIRGAVETLAPSAESRHLKLRLQLPDEPLVVDGDAARLQRVAQNLLQNAVKFTPDGGAITVTASRRDGRIAVDVEDTGQGIDPDVMPLIFERFVQGESATTRRHGGLGLGLAIVKQLVELHGGSVSAFSEGPGKGARFTLMLPALTEPPAAGRPVPGTVRRPVPDLDVLIVEDDADSRAAMALVLERLGWRIRVAGSTREAMAAFDERRPQVVLSDIGMPGEDGYSLINRIRQLEGPSDRRTVAIAMTGFASLGDQETARRAGFDDHIAKPVALDELVERLSRLSAGAPASETRSGAS